jgi:DUF1680 family protein
MAMTTRQDDKALIAKIDQVLAEYNKAKCGAGQTKGSPTVNTKRERRTKGRKAAEG